MQEQLLQTQEDPLLCHNRYKMGTQNSLLSEQFVCHCGKKYKWWDSLRRHKRVDCGNKEKKFSCHKCDKKFKYRYELGNHVLMKHDNQAHSKK